MRLSDLLKQYRKSHDDLSQRDFARQCGGRITSGYVSMLENEKNPSTGKKIRPSLDKLDALAHGMGLTLDQLLLQIDDMPVTLSSQSEQTLPKNVMRISDMHVQKVPIIGSVAAGVPILAEQEYDAYVDAPAKADFALRVDGDSMEPIYMDGDIVYIRQQDDLHDGQIGVAIMDDHAALKYVYHISNGLNLISANPKYPPRRVTYDDYDVIRILGIACGYTRMYHN